MLCNLHVHLTGLNFMDLWDSRDLCRKPRIRGIHKVPIDIGTISVTQHWGMAALIIFWLKTTHKYTHTSTHTHTGFKGGSSGHGRAQHEAKWGLTSHLSKHPCCHVRRNVRSPEGSPTQAARSQLTLYIAFPCCLLRKSV